MKLVLCEDCWDVFKLELELRKCKCGKVKGRYLDHTQAEVSPNAVSIAIGNGSLGQAVEAMRAHYVATKGKADRRAYQGVAQIVYAWVRPNEGPGNPHTDVNHAM